MVDTLGLDLHKMLDAYIRDYLMKKNLPEVAELFTQHANVSRDPVALDSPPSFLFECWSLVWDALLNDPQNHSQILTMEQQIALSRGQRIDPQMSINHIRQTTGYEQKKQHVSHEMLTMGQQMVVSGGQRDYLQMPMDCIRQAAEHEKNNQLHSHAMLTMEQEIGISGGQRAYQKMSMDCIRQAAEREKMNQLHSHEMLTMGQHMAISGGQRAYQQMSMDCMRQAAKHEKKNQLHSHEMLTMGQQMVVSGGQRAYRQKLMNCIREIEEHEKKNQLHSHERLTMGQQMAVSGGQRDYQKMSMDCIRQAAKHEKKNELHSYEMLRMGEQLVVSGGQRAYQQKPIDCIRKTAEHEKKNQLYSHKISRKRKSSSDLLTSESTVVDLTTDDDIYLDAVVDSFFSNDGDSANVMIEDAGFSFKEFFCLPFNERKVLSCDFSSDGKFIASAGHEKKVMICNLEKLEPINIAAEGHGQIITDVRFRPSSTVFATSSFDKTVQLWDANKSRNPIMKLHGHDEPVMSVDFHPRKLDLLCSCDGNDEIRLWNVKQLYCSRISTAGGNRQVRFQPGAGNLLAASIGNTINLIDVETNACQYSLKGHEKDVRSICWDSSGEYMASVSEDSARIWSIGSGLKCVHELNFFGNKFESCTFHPCYEMLLIIGSYQTLELWNPLNSNRTLSIDAHSGLISALAACPQTKMIASGSHDTFVKLWK